MKKRISMIVACTLLLSLAGCSTNNGTSEPAGESSGAESRAESGTAGETKETEETESSSALKEESSSEPVFKVLTREYIHRTDQNDQISSYYSPVYEGGPLYTGFERYTPDDIYLETVEERTYAIDESQRTLSWSPLNQTATTTYVFDEGGLLSEYKSVHANGARLFWYSMTYDDSGQLLQKVNVNDDGSKSTAVWNYTYDSSGNIIRRDDPYGAWTEYTYDEDGYPLTSVNYNEDGEKAETWSSFQYVEITGEDFPEFMGSVKQWVLADLVY